MDTSIFLSIIVFLVSLIIIAVGVYVILVLREVRENLKKVNHILSHTESMVETFDTKIAGPASSVIGVVTAVREGLSLFKAFKGNGHKKGEE
ncbi:MAG: hypothetical protein M1150_00060 [Patescibacteria group bacterium]|nr:hypothetical protein [Patescibacteria group bacterium]